MYNRIILLVVFYLLIFKSIKAQQLESRKILSQKIEIMLPSDFKQMDIETITLKYPNEGARPNEVYTNDNSSINLAFTLSSKKATSDDIKKNTNELIDILKQLGIIVASEKQEKINGKDFFIITFSSKALNGVIYNKMFFAELEGKLLIGNFNCTSFMETMWKNKADEIIKSIKLLK